MPLVHLVGSEHNKKLLRGTKTLFRWIRGSVIPPVCSTAEHSPRGGIPESLGISVLRIAFNRYLHHLRHDLLHQGEVNSAAGRITVTLASCHSVRMGDALHYLAIDERVKCVFAKL